MHAFLARWLPIDASAHGHHIDQVLVLVHWLMLVLFVGWSIYFIYVLYRFRARRNPQASYHGAQTHLSSYVEVGVAVVEAILLVGFAIPIWYQWVTPPPAEAEPLVVRVVGEQFLWNVHYPGPDGTFGRTDPGLVDAAENPLGLDRSDPAAQDDIVSLNQLYLPVDRDVTVLLSSKDVVHSFFLPQMRVKQDAIPGMQIPVHFRPTQVTPEASRPPACDADKTCWEIACAQLCGLGHFRMRGYYTVLSQGEFDAWMAQQTADSSDLPSRATTLPALTTAAGGSRPNR